MPDPSPAPSASIFGRKPSLFSSKKSSRKESTSITPISPPVSDELSPTARRDSSVISLPSSIAEGDIRRSASLRSHESQSSIHHHKARGSSIAVPSRSPIRLHRQSRSISANATHTIKPPFNTTLSPQKSSDSFSRDRQHSLAEPVPKTPFSMLATPFSHGLKRSETDRPSLTSYATNGSSLNLVPSNTTQAPQTSFVPAALLNHIHDTCRKRIATLEYLRKVCVAITLPSESNALTQSRHEGHLYYFNTLLYTPSNLNQLPSMHYSKLGRRASNYLLLGTSIPPLLDMNSDNPLDYLRSLAALLAEYDTYQQLNNPDGSVGARGRMGAMFKSGMRGVKGRRSSSAAIESLSESVESAQLDSLPLPPVSSGNLPEFTYLQTPSLPFDPDFHTAFATLADILIDTYSGVVQLLPNTESVGPGVGEAFGKADKILRKVLVQNAVQELGDTTRREVRSEIGGLGRLVLGGLM
ncbi:hypothetical protein D6D10_07378 [Aureobasidium pullulans]|uniref:Uncharacterized protein n=1 Tax=Aureobasidium pullulans TaxID=5580 RepID=A0A4S9ENA5_AURPU|nr:hypothetical protein D6D10_07378 [Aureobasidium pullulans]